MLEFFVCRNLKKNAHENIIKNQELVLYLPAVISKKSPLLPSRSMCFITIDIFEPESTVMLRV